MYNKKFYNTNLIGIVSEIENNKKDIGMANRIYKMAFWLSLATTIIFLLIGNF
jgi:hypothetical protein